MEPIQLVSTGRAGNTFVLEKRALEILEKESRLIIRFQPM